MELDYNKEDKGIGQELNQTGKHEPKSTNYLKKNILKEKINKNL